MYDLLRGLKVVEAAAFIAGPSCGLHLAQMGAEVIRIDQIGGGPDFRRWPLAPGGASLYWEGLNKAKRSVALDLTRPEGRALAARIATAPGDNAGLFVTNFPVEGFLSYERLSALRGDLICVRVMGWPDGRPAVDYTVNAAVGVPLMTGPTEVEAPVNHVLPAWDLLAGAYAAFTLLAAERDRRLTGKGREVRIPLSDLAIASLGHLGQIGEVATSGHDRPRMGNELYGAFGRDFVTADGRRLMVVAITPRQWSGLVTLLDLAAPVATLEAELGVSFARDEGVRFQHRARLIPLFEAAFAARQAGELTAAFETKGVCWGPYQGLKAALDGDGYFSTANPVLADIDHPSGARYPAAGPAATLPADARGAPTAAPTLGRDTEAVLGEVLGLSGAEIARLRDQGLAALTERAAMSDGEAGAIRPEEVEAWRSHIGRQEIRRQRLDIESLRRFAAAQGADLDVERQAPPLAHWAWFLEAAPPQSLGPDGHPLRGGLLPPVRLPRRMFAAAALRFASPMVLDQPAELSLTVADVRRRSGKTGDLVFVEVDRRLTQDGGECLAERQTIVFRQAGEAEQPVTPADVAPPPGAEPWTPRPVDLFRFSAVTFNSHRIHYDLPYATQAEGYPGLVVHGPFTAAKLFGYARARARRSVSRFEFRAAAPLFAGQPILLAPGEKAGEVQAIRCDGAVAMTATATFDD